MGFKYTGFFKDEERGAVGGTRQARIKDRLAALDKEIPELEEKLRRRKEEKVDTSLSFGKFLKASWQDAAEVADASTAIDDLKREREDLRKELKSCEKEGSPQDRSLLRKVAGPGAGCPEKPDDVPTLLGRGCLTSLALPSAFSLSSCLLSVFSLIVGIISVLLLLAVFFG